MTVPDPRWKNVKAYMGPKKEYRGREFEEGMNLEDWYEITIELRHERMYYYSFQIINKYDWYQFEPELLKLVLNEMVASIDDRLAKQEQRGASCHEYGTCVLDGDCPLFVNCYLIES